MTPLLVVVTALLAAMGTPALAQTACPPACSGQTLTMPNFSHANLAGVDFSGATLIAPVFIRANLSGANFANAKFQAAPGNPTQAPDFTFANLTNASFARAQFLSPTYFTYATLTCADFSNTDISGGKAIFGAEPLAAPTGSGCTIGFRSATMNCEFIDQWRSLDLTGAIVRACIGQLAGRTFDNAQFAGVDFSNAILDGSTFVGAVLTQASFAAASLQCGTSRATGQPQCVDFSNAQLQAATLSRANFTGATLYNAKLSNNINDQVSNAATLEGAHLKNVNLAFAQLSGVNFTSANLYGTLPNSGTGCGTTGQNSAGFTQNCASAHAATMTGTRFTGAYLYGLDLSGATIKGADFTNAVLTGANFSGASIATNPNSGAVPSFTAAYLQGTNLDAATITAADLTNAFVDFREGGNTLYAGLSGATHNTFACGSPSTCTPPTGANVCVYVFYGQPTTVPAANTFITCPSGTTGATGCGPATPNGSNRNWKSALPIGVAGNGPPPGWYGEAATYDPQAPTAQICSGRGPSGATSNW